MSLCRDVSIRVRLNLNLELDWDLPAVNVSRGTPLKLVRHDASGTPLTDLTPCHSISQPCSRNLHVSEQQADT